jgi:hypothetical protein
LNELAKALIGAKFLPVLQFINPDFGDTVIFSNGETKFLGHRLELGRDTVLDQSVRQPLIQMVLSERRRSERACVEKDEGAEIIENAYLIISPGFLVENGELHYAMSMSTTPVFMESFIIHVRALLDEQCNFDVGRLHGCHFCVFGRHWES